MTKKEALQLFENKKVRTVWDEEEEKWYFSIVDVVGVLTDSEYQTARKYWKVLKGRLKKEGNESVTNCYQLKMKSSDGKSYNTDVADTEQLFRIILSIPSKKAEPFKEWMARVATSRLDQLQDPELSIQQAIADYRRLGYSEEWINQRVKSIEVRKELTDEWHRTGVKDGLEYASFMNKHRILFVCHGNICRSPMAEYILKDMVEKAGRAEEFEIASAATSTEEIGNDLYPPARRILFQKGIKYGYRKARQITRHDYEYYDYIIAMDENNLRNLKKLLGDDVDNKISLMMSHAGCHRDVADPWYTGDFEKTYNDLTEGCKSFLSKL